MVTPPPIRWSCWHSSRAPCISDPTGFILSQYASLLPTKRWLHRESPSLPATRFLVKEEADMGLLIAGLLLNVHLSGVQGDTVLQKEKETETICTILDYHFLWILMFTSKIPWIIKSLEIHSVFNSAAENSWILSEYKKVHCPPGLTPSATSLLKTDELTGH